MSRRLAAWLLVAALAAAGCSEQSRAQSKPPAPPAVPVGAALSEERLVPVQVTTVGEAMTVLSALR